MVKIFNYLYLKKCMQTVVLRLGIPEDVEIPFNLALPCSVCITVGNETDVKVCWRNVLSVQIITINICANAHSFLLCSIMQRDAFHAKEFDCVCFY